MGRHSGEAQHHEGDHWGKGWLAAAVTGGDEDLAIRLWGRLGGTCVGAGAEEGVYAVCGTGGARKDGTGQGSAHHSGGLLPCCDGALRRVLRQGVAIGDGPAAKHGHAEGTAAAGRVTGPGWPQRGTGQGQGQGHGQGTGHSTQWARAASGRCATRSAVSDSYRYSEAESMNSATRSAHSHVPSAHPPPFPSLFRPLQEDGPAVSARGVRRGHRQVDLRVHHRRDAAGRGRLPGLGAGGVDVRGRAAGAHPAAGGGQGRGGGCRGPAGKVAHQGKATDVQGCAVCRAAHREQRMGGGQVFGGCPFFERASNFLNAIQGFPILSAALVESVGRGGPGGGGRGGGAREERLGGTAGGVGSGASARCPECGIGRAGEALELEYTGQLRTAAPSEAVSGCFGRCGGSRAWQHTGTPQSGAAGVELQEAGDDLHVQVQGSWGGAQM